MFILIHSDNELLKCDNEVTVFDSYEDARVSMLEAFTDAFSEDGVTPIIPHGGGDVYGIDEWNDRTGWLGYVTGDEAYIEDSDDKWVIFSTNPTTASATR